MTTAIQYRRPLRHPVRVSRKRAWLACVPRFHLSSLLLGVWVLALLLGINCGWKRPTQFIQDRDIFSCCCASHNPDDVERHLVEYVRTVPRGWPANAYSEKETQLVRTMRSGRRVYDPRRTWHQWNEWGVVVNALTALALAGGAVVVAEVLMRRKSKVTPVLLRQPNRSNMPV